MKKLITIVTAVILTGIAAQAQASPQILLYDNTNTNYHHAQAALNSLSLSYTVGNSDTFNPLLEGGSWDLVVVDCPSNIPTTGWTPLINYISNDGKAIMSFWNLNNFGFEDSYLADAFDVSVTYSFETPQDVYRWVPGHNIFNVPNVVGDLTSWSNEWIDDGDALMPLAGAQAIAGFTPSLNSRQAAIVLGNSGRTIYNGFLFDELNAPDSVNLIANEITYVIPEPVTICLFGLGGLGLLRRKHSKA